MFEHDGLGEKRGFWGFERKAESEEVPEERLAEAKRWEEAMGEGTPEFAGEWGYGEQAGEEDKEMEMAVEEEETAEEAFDDELAGARRIASYGFDTASRIYGLETVIDTIMKTDEIVGNAENPLGVIYRALIPNPEERVLLYQEIRKDTEEETANRGNLEREKEVLGFNQAGDFYDKAMKQPNGQQKSVEAIRAVRKLIGTLETDERFDDLRERAYMQDQTLIECLMEETDKPTVSQFLDNLGQFGEGVSEEAVEEVLDEIEEREGDSEQEDEVLEVS